jgi:hypothetical protein
VEPKGKTLAGLLEKQGEKAEERIIGTLASVVQFPLVAYLGTQGIDRPNPLYRFSLICLDGASHLAHQSATKPSSAIADGDDSIRTVTRIIE